jgi:beta-xylosidase
MGALLAGADHGQPVESHLMPDTGGVFPPVYPQTSDDFGADTLGVQWEWNHNPVNTQWSLTEKPGFLRLKSLGSQNLVGARNTLTQVQQGRVSEATARLVVSGMVDGQRAGLAMFGRRPSWVGVVQSEGARLLTFSYAGEEAAGAQVTGEAVVLRMRVEDEKVRYSFSLDDGKTFRDIGINTPMLFSWWKGARPALFTFTVNDSGAAGGIADFDWIRFRRPET